jgi:FSR family fosmidomycin resistance protein-like MFS transporter
MNRPRLWTLSLGHLVVDLTTGAIPALLPLVEGPLRLTVAALSLIVALLNFTSSVIQPLFGYLVDHWRLPWLLPAGFVTASVGMAALGFAPNETTLVALVILTGAGTAAYHPEASRAAYQAGGPQRASAMSIFSVGGNLGFALGPVFLSGFAAVAGLHGTVLFLVPALVALVLFARYGPKPDEEAAAPSRRWREGRNDLLGAALLVLAVLFRSAVIFGLATFVPLDAVHRLHTPARTAGLLDFALLGAGALGTLVGGPIADRVGREGFVATALLLATPFVALVPGSRGALLLVALALAGVFLVSTFAVTVVLNQEALPRSIGMASGMSIGLAVGLGGLLVLELGHVAETAGLAAALRALPAFTLASALLAGLFALHRRRVVRLSRQPG